MTERSTEEHAGLRGSNDLVWILFVTLCCTLLVWLMVDYLRVQREAILLANRSAVESAEARRLLEEERQLRIERALRQSELDRGRVAEDLGLAPLRADQVIRMEEHP